MLSPLQKKRLEYQPMVPDLLKSLENTCFKRVGNRTIPQKELETLFPKTYNSPSYQLVSGKGSKKRPKIGVVFSGGPAPGGHNVIAGLFDSGAELIGFLKGPGGIVENHWTAIEDLSLYRNQGGFDLIGTGRTKIETPEQLSGALQTVKEHSLDGVVIIGGDDSNTNAAILAEYFLLHNCPVKVVGVPKTIDADLRSDDIELSFGFDSATKTYSELIGNIERDALSSLKYYHFIKLMGRSASHIALECALKTRPNLTLISEEKKSFKMIIDEIISLIIRRYEKGKNHGVILIPEGLIESVPEFNELVKDLPVEKDPHGNVELSKIETEKIILKFVKNELEKRSFAGQFHALTHSFGYEGRSCLPSNFDANYCYSLGLLASIAIREGLTGVICSIQNLKNHPSQWEMKMIPTVQLMHLETRYGKNKPVIRKYLVDLNSKVFINFSSLRKSWEIEDQYQAVGPMQFYGDKELVDSVPDSL